MHPTPLDLLATAQTAALDAGVYLRQTWQQPRQIKSKGWRDLVTDADFESQRLITNLIRGRFPDHAFLTEEEDLTLPEAGSIQWIIDPIDGTSNFSRQIPVFFYFYCRCSEWDSPGGCYLRSLTGGTIQRGRGSTRHPQQSASAGQPGKRVIKRHHRLRLVPRPRRTAKNLTTGVPTGTPGPYRACHRFSRPGAGLDRLRPPRCLL